VAAYVEQDKDVVEKVSNFVDQLLGRGNGCESYFEAFLTDLLRTAMDALAQQTYGVRMLITGSATQSDDVLEIGKSEYGFLVIET